MSEPRSEPHREPHRVGLIGAGGAGARRALAVSADERSQLATVCDLDEAAAAAVAGPAGAAVAPSWQDVVDDDGIDIAIVSTSHDQLAEIGTAAVARGKHLLCEKPLGRTPAEVRGLVTAARASGVCLRAGYNHRFHPAIAGVREAVTAGQLGPLDFIHGRYGHGGRPGYDREWRGDAERAGGGELLDQGAHLIDLSIWLLGDFASVSGFTERRFWEIEPLEDNAFGHFRTATGQVASIHASWTQWKNLFRLEVFGRDGYAIAEGLGGSYGPESLRLGQRRPEGGLPTETETIFAGEDHSWSLEWASLLDEIDGCKTAGASGAEALRTMEWIHRLYQAAATGRAVTTADGVR